MFKSLSIACFATLSLLTACASVPEERLTIPRAEVTETQRIAHTTVALRNVSLPTYAAGEAIFTADATGLLRDSGGLLWADDPSRAMTLELARHLTGITGARVASEPWPFLDPAAAEVEIRVEEMLARADGTFHLSGQYFVSSEQGRDRARLFDLQTGIGAETTPEALAAARARLIRDLALDLAKRGLR
ncbi:hypothetical protein RA2_02754 [Roseovarius sp. A-2]|uniref:PqiC family protein n=1 Tax=Roseovarius sp. A-2 TaxID=1570360 RepID=UPI0009B570CA|nr:ABC-type transport auxiliary lipoprotein family protein [Roseovarius sp. A-2]GAW35687.1 hypothetical protein RA2_02754 [Roseovarius sp. A-2]